MSLPPRDEAMMEAIGQVLIEEIERAVAPLRLRIAELEQRGVEYLGVYQRALSYRRGSFVTFDNNLHVAVTDVEPNQIPLQCSSWQLCLRGTHDDRRTGPRKHGADAMGARS